MCTRTTLGLASTRARAATPFLDHIGPLRRRRSHRSRRGYDATQHVRLALANALPIHFPSQKADAPGYSAALSRQANG
eukprot:5736719-Pleurochrysis_carterae.AAC.1